MDRQGYACDGAPEGAAESAERPEAASSSYRLVVDHFGALPALRARQANGRSVQCPIEHRCHPRRIFGI